MPLLPGNSHAPARRCRYNAVKDQEELEKVQRYICNRAAGVCKKKPTRAVRSLRSFAWPFFEMTCHAKNQFPAYGR